MHGNVAVAYQKANVLTADPKRLVIMCYEGAIRNLKLARNKYLTGEYEVKAKALQKAEDILDELSCALDLEKGGQIAENLRALYAYMRRRILEGDTNREVGILDEVTGMLEELKHAWEESFYGTKKGLAGPVDSRVSNQSANQDTHGSLGTL